MGCLKNYLNIWILKNKYIMWVGEPTHLTH